MHINLFFKRFFLFFLNHLISEIEEILRENLTLTERVIVELLYGCGLRVSELTNLKITNFDLSAKYLTAFGKGSKERIVPLGKKAIEALNDWFACRNIKLDPELQLVIYDAEIVHEYPNTGEVIVRKDTAKKLWVRNQVVR